MIYTYAATASDNGSSFGGISANMPWFNISTTTAMLAGRFLHGVPILALAGSLAAKTRAAPSAGTFPTHGPLFVGLFEHFLMLGGKTF
jgi:K+-transporting ATPase ATPase A chain